MRCQYCGAEVSLPFKCPFCGGYFCTRHRLPENHNCPEIWKAWLPRRDLQPPPVSVPRRVSYGGAEPIPPPLPYRGRAFWFSFKELTHLLAGVLMVMGVGLSIFLSPSPLRLGLYDLLSSALIFVSIFIFHELAHKAVAQYYGLWAEFRLSTIGALITLFSIISPIKLISPGVVLVLGEADKERLGKISLAGPLVNIIFSVGFLVSALYIGSMPIKVGAIFSPWVALFNLIPLGILDGAKVISWNSKVWGVCFTASILLSIIAVQLFML